MFTHLLTFCLATCSMMNFTVVAPKTKDGYVILPKTPVLMIGIECRTINTPDAAPHDISKLWSRFYSEKILEKIPNKTSNQIIALYTDYEGDHTQPYTCVIGCAVSSAEDIPEGMTAKIIPTATYAAYRATGDHPQALINIWNTIWNSNLERTYTGDFEIYEEDFISQSPQQVKVYVAINPCD